MAFIYDMYAGEASAYRMHAIFSHPSLSVLVHLAGLPFAMVVEDFSCLPTKYLILATIRPIRRSVTSPFHVFVPCVVINHEMK